MKVQASIFLLLLSNLCFADEKLEIVFTKPNCTVKEYQTSVKSLNNIEYNNSKDGVFCSFLDFNKTFNVLNSNVGIKLKSILSNTIEDPIEEVKISSYIFSDESVANLICNSYKMKKFKVSIFTQYDSRKVGKEKTFNILNECLGSDLNFNRIGCNVFSDICDKKNINTMHMKLIEVKRSSQKNYQIFGSGNIGKGIYANLEDWLFLIQNNQSIHSCVWDVLKNHSESLNLLKIRYLSCHGKNVNNNIEFLFLPFESKSYYNNFLNLSDLSTEINIVSPDFKDKKLNSYLMKFVENGGVVNFFTNSEVYYSFLYNDEQGNSKPNDIQLMLDLKKFKPSQVKIFFVDTNFYFSIVRNTLHHKLIVFSNSNNHKNNVITGSANLNFNALNRQYEQTYIIHNEFADNYLYYIDFLKGVSTEFNDMPTTRPKIKEPL